MEVPELLTRVKNKVKGCANLPEKYKLVVYHLLKKVFEEVCKEEGIKDDNPYVKSTVLREGDDDVDSFDLPDFMKDIFRDRSKR